MSKYSLYSVLKRYCTKFHCKHLPQSEYVSFFSFFLALKKKEKMYMQRKASNALNNQERDIPEILSLKGVNSRS